MLMTRCDAVDDIAAAELVEDYRARERVLALQCGADGRPIHVVWAISQRQQAVLVPIRTCGTANSSSGRTDDP
jgi:hypothetical protein